MISMSSEHFQFMIEKDESPILSVYLQGARRAGVRDVLEEVRVHAAAADSDRGVSKPRRFLGAHRWTRRDLARSA